MLWDWIEQLGKDEARPEIRGRHATDRGRETVCEVRELIQKGP